MYYINTIPYNRKNIPQNRGFILPFALGFISAPILLYPYYKNYNTPYYNYYYK